jgi:hypothetical protein
VSGFHRIDDHAFVKEKFENNVRAFHGGVNLHFGVTKKMDAVCYFEMLIIAWRQKYIMTQ